MGVYISLTSKYSHWGKSAHLQCTPDGPTCIRRTVRRVYFARPQLAINMTVGMCYTSFVNAGPSTM